MFIYLVYIEPYSGNTTPRKYVQNMKPALRPDAHVNEYFSMWFDYF